MAITYHSFSELTLPEPASRALQTLRNIFFETSTRKNFSSDSERTEFEYRYLGVYLKNPDFIFYAQEANGKVLGYCLGAPQTTPEHFSLHPYLSIFESEIALYPSHLHINLTESARGFGVGSRLIDLFEEKCRMSKSVGVHLITAKGARNTSFYAKNLYREIALRRSANAELLMLGKKL